ncbi:hypothetical protein NPIL_101 [Nephila pilipes]|uniref:Uncharacterized protein n=1 Tax=Nephila pilipes TaxID=299642 RepID=A0A8X6Q7G1_NEPPI|nr:hypothetical protein NPIL_101 [Nephila pilipes]
MTRPHSVFRAGSVTSPHKHPRASSAKQNAVFVAMVKAVSDVTGRLFPSTDSRGLVGRDDKGSQPRRELLKATDDGYDRRKGGGGTTHAPTPLAELCHAEVREPLFLRPHMLGEIKVESTGLATVISE